MRWNASRTPFGAWGCQSCIAICIWSKVSRVQWAGDGGGGDAAIAVAATAVLWAILVGLSLTYIFALPHISDIAATICGLFGYNEFVNWRNVMEIGSWLEGDSPKDMDVLADDGDSQHISDLALVFYTNALLLLH